MGTRWVLHFDNDVFLKSVNKAKWNIYAVSLQDLTIYTLSYLSVFFNFQETDKAKKIYESILKNETQNEMPQEIIDKGIESFSKRLEKVDWNIYYKSWPFNESALALYEWAPIAPELKTLDRKIVLNSMILKWDIIKKEFESLIQF